jgi:hypothetical protein
MYFLYPLVTFVIRVIALFELHLQGLEWNGIAQAVYLLATDCTVRDGVRVSPIPQLAVTANVVFTVLLKVATHL